MQSGYGVSGIPQFLVDGLCSPLFPSSSEEHPPATSSAAAPAYHLYHFPQAHHLQQFYQEQQPAAPPPLPPQQLEPRFPQFHPVPITQQLFDQTHQFHLFEQQRRGLHAHLGLDHDSPPPPDSAPPQPPPFMSFRLAVNENSAAAGTSKEALNDDDALLPADEEACESRINLWAAPPPPAREEEAAIKEPFWRPLDIDYINRNNKRCNEKEAATAAVLEQPSPKQVKKSKEVVVADSDETPNTTTNYKLFSELEAICKPGAAAGGGIGGGIGGGNNPTGSSSALTGENLCPAALPPAAPNCHESPPDHASNASTDEDGSLKKSSTSSGKARRRKRRKQQFTYIAAFFESLMKQLMDHQESLHHRFLEVLENRDRERAKKEQQWREQESTRSANDARARAEQHAAAAAREAAIISFLEKITGQPLNLPPVVQFENEETHKQGNPYAAAAEASDENRAVGMNSNRWPKAEVQALIKVRSGLESRFQEPGLKGPLWEEVSSMMASIGYNRSAKRCKEKWENINKYFRKTKESNKKRTQHSKTCPYFHQLDQLYSKSHTGDDPMEVDRRANSELLDAIVVHKDNRPSDLQPRDQNCPQEIDHREQEEDEEEDDEDHAENEEEEEGDEGEDETQGISHWSKAQLVEETHRDHTSLFFHTVQS